MQSPPPIFDVPRDQVVVFALFTHERGVLKITAQLYPLKPNEPREARLEFQREGKWVEAARGPVVFPGWSESKPQRLTPPTASSKRLLNGALLGGCATFSILGSRGCRG